LPLLSAQDEPGSAHGPSPRRLDAPATAHAEVAAEDETALECEQDVLADRLDLLESAPVDPSSDSEGGCARVWRRGREDLPLEHAQPVGGAVERVALRHGGRRDAAPRGIRLPAGAA
jgi:hypothetical protein